MLISFKLGSSDTIAIAVVLQSLREGPVRFFRSEGVQDPYHNLHLLNLFKTIAAGIFSAWRTTNTYRESEIWAQ